MRSRSERRTVVLVLFDQAKLLDITGPLQVFNDARLDDGRPAYQLTLASEAGGPISTDTGVAIDSVPLAVAMRRKVDTLLVVGCDPEDAPRIGASVGKALAPYIERPRRIGSICGGAFVLAGLGLLDGREATTHWASCTQLQRDYPRIKVKPDSIFVESDGVWTSAGVSAGIDMALAMVEDDLGHVAALSVARSLVLFLKRPGGQSQFSIELRRQIRDARGRFDDLHDWIRAHLDGDLSVPTLAAVARMSPRNFARAYLRETGQTPARAIEQLRVEAARHLLESAPVPVQQIALRVGFGDDERMRRAFVKAHGVSPQDYRSRFGRQASA